MSDFLKHLPAAPWKATTDFANDPVLLGPGGSVLLLSEWDDEAGTAAIEFAALARNALDVQMRRLWGAIHDYDGWCVVDDTCTLVVQDEDRRYWFDPYTALCQADAWYKANVEATPK